MSSYSDLRDWLRQVETMGELRSVKGADWNLEIGAVTDLVAKKSRDNWALLFDEIKAYPAGYRILTCILESPSRLALTVGLEPVLGDREFVLAWRERLKTLEPIPPEFVEDGPVMENIHSGDQVDLWEFPSPRWHELDGGRYIGTASTTVTRDPDEGWVNLGTYRVMVHDERTAGFYISPGKDGRIHRDKYFARGKACPVAVAAGGDPLLFLVSTMPITHTSGGFESEYHWAGGVRRRPVQVIKGRVTGLPIPAHAEIVLEGWAYPGEERMEGPFGEWTGYYASAQRPEPIIKVEAIYHRNDPIICGVENSRMPSDFSHAHELMRAAQLWAELEAAGVPDVRGVAFYQNRFITVVSIKQQYAGHAKQAAMLAMQCHSGAYLGRYVIVVDEDINVYDFNEVVWAVSTRVDPAKDIEVVTHCWSGSLDPIIPPEEKGFNSRAMIDATKPYGWHKKFPISSIIKPELKARVLKKWEGQELF